MVLFMTASKKIMLSLLGGAFAASVVCNAFLFTGKKSEAPAAEKTAFGQEDQLEKKIFQPSEVIVDLASRQFYVDFPAELASPQENLSERITVTPEPENGISINIHDKARLRVCGAFKINTPYRLEVKPGITPRYPIDYDKKIQWLAGKEPVIFEKEYSVKQEIKDEIATAKYPERDYLPRNYTAYSDSVSIFFDSRIHSKLDLKNIVQITPAMDFKAYISDGSTLRIMADFKPDTLYKITLKPQMQPAKMIDHSNRTKWRIAKKPFTISFYTPKPIPSMSLVDTGTIYPLNASVYELPVSSHYAEGTVHATVRKLLPEHYVNFIHENSYYNRFPEVYSVEISSGKYPIGKSLKTHAAIVGADFQKMGIPRKAGIYQITMQMYDSQNDMVNSPRRKIIQLTDLMPLMTRTGNDYNFAVLSLTDSKPVAGAKIKLYCGKRLLIATLTTDQNGFASISEVDVEKKILGEDKNLLCMIVEHGDDTTILKFDHFSDVHDPDPAKNSDYAFVTPERDLYKPAEKATFFALLRSGIDKKAKANVPVSWVIQYPDGSTFRKASGTTDSNGFCRTTLEIPADVPTGTYRTILYGGDEKCQFGSKSFSVAEFTPDALTMTTESKLDGNMLENSGTVKYYFGAPAAKGVVSGKVFAEWSKFSSKRFKDYSFISPADVKGKFPYERHAYDTIKTETDNAGKFQVQTEIKPLEKTVIPVRFCSQITVRGAASRSISAPVKYQTKHFADHYIGVKMESTEGDAVSFSVKAVTPEDKEVEKISGLTAELFSSSWYYVRTIEDDYAKNVWQEEKESVEKCAVANGKISFRDLAPGNYHLYIRSADSTVQNVYHFWFSGGESGTRVSDPSKLYFTLDREKYQPGETAAITFDSMLTGTGVAFAGDASIRTKHTFDVKKGRNTIRIPIPANHGNGDYHASITVVGKANEKDLNFIYLEGIASLKVDQLARKLAVTIQAPEKARPAETISVKLQLKNEKDKTPASGIIQLWAVDSGVLALTNFKTPDPYQYFFRSYDCAFQNRSNLSNLFYVENFKEKLIGGGAPSIEGTAKYLSDLSESAKTSATFLLDTVKIPASGETTVSVKLPDHTGELTVMAIAANPEKLGSAEQKIILRDDISVQSTVPRVLAANDEFSFNFEVFNNELPEGEVSWKISDLKGAVSVRNTAQEGKFKLAKGASKAVDGLTFKVSPDTKSCSFRLTVTLNGKTITEDCKITVRPALPKQTFVTSKWLKKGESITIKMDRRKDSMEIGSSAIMISGALEFLKEYPYGCTEQVTAGAFPYLAVKPLVESGMLNAAFHESAESIIDKTINDLTSRRVYGAWCSMWYGNGTVWEDGSFFVWHFLLEAAAAGHTVDEDFKKAIDTAASSYIQNRFEKEGNRAYVTYILSLLRPSKAARYAHVMLSNDTEKFNLYSRFLLAAAMIRGGMAAEGMVELKKVINTGFCDTSAGVFSIDSLERRLGLALWILADIVPAEDPALMNIVNRINSLIRQNGHWGSTQANAWCVLGLAKYSGKLNSTKTDAAVTVGSKTIPLNRTIRLDNITETVTVKNNGDAPIYIRHSEYKQPEKFVPVSNTLKISKAYYNADGKTVTKAKKGELLTVKVEITSPNDTFLDNLVLVDLLPGGLEIEDPSFKTRYSFRKSNRYNDRFGDRTERRFDRAVIFGKIYSSQNKVIATYQVRAVTPGKFVIPPAQIESMYSPEIRATGRSADVLEVE